MILCGGAGTRLWPVSRQGHPKHLLPLTGEQTSLEMTAERVSGDGFSSLLIVSGEDQGSTIQRQLQDAGAAVEAILLEPMGRNTAAAAALAALWLQQRGSDELMLLMPSDHVIGDRESFLKAVAVAALHARGGGIVTFGATPTGPNTQYGYIEARSEGRLSDGAFSIASFHEKPDSATAVQYVDSGRFFWNCGIFLVSPATLLEEMRLFLPESLDYISRALTGATNDGLLVRPSPDEFARAENISIDDAVMEKTSRGVVVPVDMKWSDVGAWDAVWELAQKDADGNATVGSVIALDTRDCLLRSEGGAVIATLGLEKLAVIAVKDAILVAPLDRASELKSLVEQIKGERPELLIAPSNEA